ncbi:MAG: hypothetical protein ACC608_00725 [Anaerofustis sp.]
MDIDGIDPSCVKPCMVLVLSDGEYFPIESIPMVHYQSIDDFKSSIVVSIKHASAFPQKIIGQTVEIKMKP